MLDGEGTADSIMVSSLDPEQLSAADSGGGGVAKSTGTSVSGSQPEPSAPAYAATPVNRGLLRDVCEAPDDDAPREAYASWLESQGASDAAELIRLQLARFRDDIEQRCYSSRPTPRERQLLAHAVNLDKLAGYAVPQRSVSIDRGYELHRGFVEFLRITAETFLRGVAEIFALTPVRHLELLPVRGIQLANILEHGDMLRRLETLSLPRWKLDDRAASQLAPHLAEWDLVGIELVGNVIGYEGVRVLAESSPPALLRLDLTGNPCDPRDVPDYDDDRQVRFETTEAGRRLEQELRARIRWLHPGDPAELVNADRYHLRLLARTAGVRFEAADLPAVAVVDEAVTANPFYRI